MAIIGAHALLYSTQPEALRSMLRDVFGWKHVDAGGGWLIFALPPAELGVHPCDGPTYDSGVRHQVSFMCDDIHATIDELRAKGVEVKGQPHDEGYGITVMLGLPGDVEVMLYQPRHAMAIPPAKKGLPDGYHQTVTPYLLTPNAAVLIDFLTRAFGAEERIRMKRPDGSVQHAQVKIGESVIMLGEPKEPFKPTPASNYVYLADADAAYHQAIKAGATVVVPIADQFWGDRTGGVRDSQGNLWWIATRKTEVSSAEMMDRAAKGGAERSPDCDRAKPTA